MHKLLTFLDGPFGLLREGIKDEILLVGEPMVNHTNSGTSFRALAASSREGTGNASAAINAFPIEKRGGGG